MSDREEYSGKGKLPDVEFDMFTPAIYCVRVAGHLDPRWTERLSGLTITCTTSESESVVTTLQGELKDQAALIGVLNVLFDRRLSLLSVEFHECV